MLNRRQFLQIALAASALGPATSTAFAQDAYPSKSVRLIIPFAAGGPTDTIGRLVAQTLRDEWKQTVVPENRAGASGVTGSQIVAKSPPDGYTLVLGNSASHTVSELLSPATTPYKGLRDFAPVAHLGGEPLLITARKELGVTDIKGLIALAKSKPNDVKFATTAVGASSHLIYEAFMLASEIKMRNVPYTGVGPASLAIMSGEIDTMIAGVSNLDSLVDSGKINVLAVVAPERLKSLPNVPTLREQGVNVALQSWFGVFAPAGTPDAILEKINRDLNRGLDTPEMRERVAKVGFVLDLVSREKFAAMIKDYSAEIAHLVAAAKIKVE